MKLELSKVFLPILQKFVYYDYRANNDINTDIAVEFAGNVCQIYDLVFRSEQVQMKLVWDRRVKGGDKCKANYRWPQRC